MVILTVSNDKVEQFADKNNVRIGLDLKKLNPCISG